MNIGDFHLFEQLQRLGFLSRRRNLPRTDQAMFCQLLRLSQELGSGVGSIDHLPFPVDHVIALNAVELDWPLRTIRHRSHQRRCPTGLGTRRSVVVSPPGLLRLGRLLYPTDLRRIKGRARPRHAKSAQCGRLRERRPRCRRQRNVPGDCPRDTTDIPSGRVGYGACRTRSLDTGGRILGSDRSIDHTCDSATGRAAPPYRGLKNI
ncbi:hypothetical protein S2M10_23720 [Sphingomonas sp. S2M10]|nr:hypothetical protein [Sphingomonas sp. S2M10]